MEETFTNILENALQLTQAANLPPHLEPIAFEKAIDSLTGREKPRLDQLRTMTTPARATKLNLDSSASPVQAIAEKLTLDSATVEEIFSPDEENGIQLIVGAGKLGTEKKAAMRSLAILVAGGRQLGGIEEWTNVTAIREVCQQYGRLDAKNFSTTVLGLDDVFGFRGKGAAREVRINRTGWDELKVLIARLTGNGKAES